MIVGHFGRNFADYGSPTDALLVSPIKTLWEINGKTYTSEGAIATTSTETPGVTTITYPLQNQPMAVQAVVSPTSTTLSVESLGPPAGGGSPGSGGGSTGGSPGSGGGSTGGSPGSGSAITGAAPPMSAGTKFPWKWVIVGAVGVAAIVGVAVMRKKGGGK